MEDLEYVIEHCSWRQAVYDTHICAGAVTPCSVAITKGQCATVKEFLERERRLYDGKRFNTETIGM